MQNHKKAKHNTEKISVILTAKDIRFLKHLVSRGTHKARTIIRARILLYSHDGKSNKEIVDALGCAPRITCDVRNRYLRTRSVEQAVYDAPRPGQPKKITADHEAFVIATACTDAPLGHSHWTLDALKEKLIATYDDLRSVSHERIRHILLSAELKPWREKMWCVPNLTPLFRERMDAILALYTEPLPKGHEVHNFDETPKLLLSTPHGGYAPKPKKHRKLDYEYKRNGRRNIFVAVAPFIGTRIVVVTKRRTAVDTADFLWNYCMVTHKKVIHIHLVLDNLNTHTEGSLRKVWGERKANRFFARVTFHFTPPHASWLNMAELEINALKTQGLKRRIETETEMQHIAGAIVNERNSRYAKISWGFTSACARKRFPVLYL